LIKFKKHLTAVIQTSENIKGAGTHEFNAIDHKPQR
jgi:hypothetical protein